MKEYRMAQIQRYMGKYILVCVRNENEESKSLNLEFNTLKEAIAKFKCHYAPIGTKQIVKVAENTYFAN
jgi:hypothetical protein